MGIRERKQAVRDVLAAYAASDTAALRILLTENVLWWVPPSAGSRYARPISGIDAALEVLAGPSRSYRKPTIRWTVHHIVADESDIVMANASMTAVLINGNPYANDYCYVFRFEGDRIAEGTEYADTAHAMQLASAPPTT